MNQPAIFMDKDIRAVRPDDIGSGAVLGIHAAIALHCGHMDVGLADFHILTEKIPPESRAEEYFYDSGESVSLPCPPGVMDIRIKKGARLCSDLSVDSRCFVGAYLYENADGRRFLVFNCDGEEALGPGRLALIDANSSWLAGE